jgi:hypothetical protein
MTSPSARRSSAIRRRRSRRWRSPNERKALLAGDVAWLYQRGAHPYLLAYMLRWGLFGLTAPVFSERMRALAGKENAAS